MISISYTGTPYNKQAMKPLTVGMLHPPLLWDMMLNV